MRFDNFLTFKTPRFAFPLGLLSFSLIFNPLAHGGPQLMHKYEAAALASSVVKPYNFRGVMLRTDG